MQDSSINIEHPWPFPAAGSMDLAFHDGEPVNQISAVCALILVGRLSLLQIQIASSTVAINYQGRKEMIML